MKRPFGSEPMDDELQPLDPELVSFLTSLGAGGRDPLRRSAGRAAVMAAAARSREAARRDRGVRWRRRAAVAALGFAGANLALGGVVALAAGAQPDSVFYGVKRAAEDAKLALTFDPQEKARLELQLADRRASEAAAMAHNGQSGLALQAARDATSLVQEARDALGANPSVENEQALRHASDEARARLEAVFAALENSSDPGAAEAARGLDATWHNGLGSGRSGNGATGAPGSSGEEPGASAAPGSTPGAGAAGSAGEGAAGSSLQPTPPAHPTPHPHGTPGR